MNLSRPARILIVSLVVVGVLGYAAVVEFGLSAGRVHDGVTVDGLDLGGMTLEDASNALERRGELLRTEPILFSAEGMTRCLIPYELGWGPQSFATAEAAMDVGRKGGAVSALGDRMKAWVWGIDVDWVGRPSWHSVTDLLDEWERQAEAAGFELRRFLLRKRVRRAIVTWPRRPFGIPLRPGVELGVDEGAGSDLVLSPSEEEVSELGAASCDNLPD
ncbi:MAG: hypothetical protein ACRDJJ_09510 [Actinomycetota bacterium]